LNNPVQTMSSEHFTWQTNFFILMGKWALDIQEYDGHNNFFCLETSYDSIIFSRRRKQIFLQGTFVI
jgi:hypothetical protein